MKVNKEKVEVKVHEAKAEIKLDITWKCPECEEINYVNDIDQDEAVRDVCTLCKNKIGFNLPFSEEVDVDVDDFEQQELTADFEKVDKCICGGNGKGYCLYCRLEQDKK